MQESSSGVSLWDRFTRGEGDLAHLPLLILDFDIDPIALPA